jgi:beta-lysine 5,6-aminomutase beta subunit
MSGRPSQIIRAYGDRKDDGRIQMSFTLPVAPSGRAKEAARRFAESLGLGNVLVATMEQAGENFSFFVVYGNADVALDYSAIEVPEVTVPDWDFSEVNEHVREGLKRKVVVVGACTGSDAHTVGIDAILNMKGFAGDKGLEAYPWFDAHNLGAQVDNVTLLTRAKELAADAILVSQVMTQRDLHIENSQALIELARKNGMRGLLFLLGGPRIDHKLARELGYDAGFGPGTRPSQVASYIVDALLKRAH